MENYENYENLTADNFDSFDDYENYLKKKKSIGMSKSSLPMDSNPLKRDGNALLNIKIVNATAAVQNLELFNPNSSVALINNPAVSALNPFTAADVVAVNTNNLIYFNRAGGLVYDVAAGLMTTTITNNGVTYRQLFESTKTMRFRIWRCKYSFVNDPQADNGINFFYNSTFGKQTTNEITPSNFKAPINPQTKLLDMGGEGTALNWLIDCESGIRQNINIGETVGMALSLNGVERGLVWPK